MWVVGYTFGDSTVKQAQNDVIHVHGVHDTCMKVLCTNPECRIYIASLGRLPNLLIRYFKPEDFCITHKVANVIQLLANFMTIRPEENLSINPDILKLYLNPEDLGIYLTENPRQNSLGFTFLICNLAIPCLSEYGKYTTQCIQNRAYISTRGI